jgi:hypothetical protein
MLARSFVAAWLLLGPPDEGAQAQVAERPAPGASDAKPSPRADDRTRRVRELIYFFRGYRVFSRDGEWARTIRELTTIGKDAVPELVAELDRTDRDATIRSLAFTLRAIGDPRAVPALIRAIPKALRPPGSDCGVIVVDPDLRKFMKAHQNYKNDEAEDVACGRPVNEILSALERITGHREPPEVGDNDPLRHVFLGGDPEEQARRRAQFEERRKRWESWWSEHRGEFVSPEELRTVELPRRGEDLVERAGLDRYGPLFPTGPGVRLGPVRMLRLTTSEYANARSHLDFETGRAFCQYEGFKATDWGERDEFVSKVIGWYQKNGIDVRCQGSLEGLDLQLWLVDDHRWDTIEDEVQKVEPLRLGREASSYLARFDRSANDLKYDELATFLFTTREGGRGILQVFPSDRDADRLRLRYRMWMTGRAGAAAVSGDARSAAERRGARSPGTPFGKVVTAVLERPAQGWAFLLDLETGRKAAPPEFVKPQELANAYSLAENGRFARWCREQEIDVFGYLNNARAGAVAAPAPAKAKVARQVPEWSLIGLEMVEARILPQTFDDMTVEEAREILERAPERRSDTAWMGMADHLLEHPDTFAFRTREGTLGLLQMEAAGKDAGELTIRYRLERRD